MDIKKEYERWLANATADADVVAELKTLDDAKIEDAFYRDLAFGTGGLRGVIGAGTNRMNIYTVAKASQGLADYLKKNFETPSVAIGYDSRIKSDVFAKVAAGVFAANGVKVNIWPVLMPVPSFSLQILSISLIFAIYGGLITSVYNITQGREKENLMATTVSAIINCGLNLYMIPKYSLYGAAFTTLLSELFVFVFCTLRAPNKKRFFDVDEIKNSILYAVVGSILVLLTTKVVYMLVECSALLRLIIAVALSAVVYITYLIIFKNKYTIDIVRNIMVKIKKKY